MAQGAGLGGASGFIQQLMQGAQGFGSSALKFIGESQNPGGAPAGQNFYGALQQGQLPKFSDAIKYATQMALNDALNNRYSRR